jgi:alginate O-acetyltransferase complex protein AlgJ
VQNKTRANENRENIATVSVFLFVTVALALISVSNCFNSSDKIAVEEKRMLAPLPKLRLRSPTLSGFSAAFNAFFNDRFAYRQQLFCLITYISYRIFAVSNSPSVVIGQHNWLFFLAGGDEETARHYPLFSRSELESWGRVLEARRAWLAARNIKFLFVVAPSKCSIYGEELPSAYKPIFPQSQQDQLLDYLRKHSKVSVVDLRPTLIDAKKFMRLYYYTDTHWTHAGAYIAYTKIAERLKSWFSQIEPVGFSSVRIDNFRFDDGDLQNMLGLHGLIPEMVSRALPQKRFPYKKCEIGQERCLEATHMHEENAPYATELDKPNLPRAVCLRDSFMAAMAPWLSANFHRIEYYWQQDFPQTVIEREKPDVVIEEIVERELVRSDPQNPPDVDQALDREYLASKIDKSKLAGTSAIKLQ